MLKRLWRSYFFSHFTLNSIYTEIRSQFYRLLRCLSRVNDISKHFLSEYRRIFDKINFHNDFMNKHRLNLASYSNITQWLTRLRTDTGFRSSWLVRFFLLLHSGRPHDFFRHPWTLILFRRSNYDRGTFYFCVNRLTSTFLCRPR